MLIRVQWTDLFRRLSIHANEHGSKIYTKEYLKEKWPALNWLVLNLCRSRHWKQLQLLIVGQPNTHKSNLIKALSEFVDIYMVPRRAGDFTGGGTL